MAAMVTCDLSEFWRKKEVEKGHIITVAEVARKTGISYDAIQRLKSGGTTRFDAPVLAKVCEFFEVPDGQPIPFLRIHYRQVA